MIAQGCPGHIIGASSVEVKSEVITVLGPYSNSDKNIADIIEYICWPIIIKSLIKY